jgi:O-antigen ligase
VNTTSDLPFPQASGALAVSIPAADIPRKNSAVNAWLVVLLILGSIIAFADGTTRDPLPGDELPVAPVMEYQPYWGAAALALLSLPLCFLYVSKAGGPAREGFLLWFVFNTVTYTKDFSYLHLPGFPVFVTDIALVILLYSFVRPLKRWLTPITWWTALLFTFIAVGTVCFIRGVEGGDTLTAFRDFAIVVYSLFVLVGISYANSWDVVRRLYCIIAVGLTLATLNGLAWFISQPEQRRFIHHAGMYVLTGLLGALILTDRRIIAPSIGWLLAGCLGIGLLLSNARSLYVALGVALSFIFLLAPSTSKKTILRRVKWVVYITAIALCLTLIMAQTRGGSAFLERTWTELVSGTVHYEDDPNATFRILAWLEAFQRFAQHPILGEGYGIPFAFELSDLDPRPHNTYLTVLYKMGAAGLIPLAMFLALFHWKGWRCVRRLRQPVESSLLYALLIGHVVMCACGLLNLLLESPFLASMFWLLSGVGIRMTYLAQQKNGHLVLESRL